ncbi:hypothetical protein [Roseibium album]|uniref:hypothetical protein n=1 Tax=Roseibium album TaxID=311410 RepID=UPI0024936C40|nr:hypothetical protein [Roseibium album]
MRLRAKTDPVTIAWARARGARIQVHCLRCCKMTVIGLDRFADHELIPDLTRHHTFRCTRCGSTNSETRPDYPEFGSGNLTWYGLTKAE